MRYTLILLFLCISMPSLAADKLTEDGIRKFYKRAAEVQLEGAKPAIEFFEKHIHKDAQMTLNMITNVKGAPPQKETVKHDKKSLLRDTRTGYKTSKLNDLENTVLAIKIANDGKSAKVKDTTYGSSTMNIPTPGGILPYNLEQSMLCDGEIVLGDDGTIQSKDSTCNVEMTMTPVE